jgi:hypothetical protein
MLELFFGLKHSLQRAMITENFRPSLELLEYGPANWRELSGHSFPQYCASALLKLFIFRTPAPGIGQVLGKG